MTPTSVMLEVRRQVTEKLMERPEFKNQSPYQKATKLSAKIVDRAMVRMLTREAMLDPYFD